MGGWLAVVVLVLGCAGVGDGTGAISTDEDRVVRVPLASDGSVSIAKVVDRLGEAVAVRIDPPDPTVTVPIAGRSRSLGLRSLADALQPGVRVEVDGDALVVTIAPDPANSLGSAAWRGRLDGLAARARDEAARRARYGLRARESYRPNDPARPTVCLLHGLNSSSLVFKHLIPPLEAAGYGVVTFDFAYNRALAETTADFGRDLAAFRRERGESARWVLLGHSMGALVARGFVEAAGADGPGAVAAILMVAPPNHGSSLAQGQTVMQAVQALRSVRGERRVDPLASLGDGLGVAADDLSPGSPYLVALNARARRAGVAYRILAGDSAYLDADARRRVEAQLATAGPVGGLGRLVAGGLKGPLDEVTDGRGDGCVAVSSARLAGVDDFRVIHANHLELIRAPLLFAEPGEVAGWPTLLGWLGEVAPAQPSGR